MANIKQQKKRIKQAEVRAARNKSVRSELKTRTKNADDAIAAGEDAEAATALAVKRIDKAASNGVIHKNAAARRKSRLMRRLAAAED